MNPVIVAAGADAAKTYIPVVGSNAKQGAAVIWNDPRHFAGVALIVFGVMKGVPWRDMFPDPPFPFSLLMSEPDEQAKQENALIGAGCVALGLWLVSK